MARYSNRVAVDTVPQINGDDLEVGMLVSDSDGDVFIYTDEGCLVNLKTGDQYSNHITFEPYVVLSKVTLFSERG